MTPSPGETANGLETRWDRFVSFATRLTVWVSLFAVVYFLRSFFLLIFLTFVFSYIQSQAVDRLSGYIKNRSFRVVLVALCFLGVLIAVGSLLVPQIRREALIFANNYGNYLRTFDEGILALRSMYPILTEFVPDGPEVLEGGEHVLQDPKHSITSSLLQKLFGFGESEAGGENVKAALDVLRNIGVHLIGAGSAFLLSLLFSFLVVLDLPRLTRTVVSLEETKLGFVYQEVAGSIYTFGKVLGKAFEAQFFIAILNTIFTAIGLWIIGITEKLAFLSMIVFLCSFIPLAGVFVSSVPICLVALQGSGVGLMFVAILLITVIHMIEAYILNPKIFGHHLHMNPVLVLTILTIGGKLFGVWGLVLGLPVCNYFFRYAIRYEERRNQN